MKKVSKINMIMLTLLLGYSPAKAVDWEKVGVGACIVGAVSVVAGIIWAACAPESNEHMLERIQQDYDNSSSLMPYVEKDKGNSTMPEYEEFLFCVFNGDYDHIFINLENEDYFWDAWQGRSNIEATLPYYYENITDCYRFHKERTCLYTIDGVQNEKSVLNKNVDDFNKLATFFQYSLIKSIKYTSNEDRKKFWSSPTGIAFFKDAQKHGFVNKERIKEYAEKLVRDEKFAQQEDNRNRVKEEVINRSFKCLYTNRFALRFANITKGPRDL